MKRTWTLCIFTATVAQSLESILKDFFFYILRFIFPAVACILIVQSEKLHLCHSEGQIETKLSNTQNSRIRQHNDFPTKKCFYVTNRNQSWMKHNLIKIGPSVFRAHQLPARKELEHTEPAVISAGVENTCSPVMESITRSRPTHLEDVTKIHQVSGSINSHQPLPHVKCIPNLHNNFFW